MDSRIELIRLTALEIQEIKNFKLLMKYMI